MHTSYKVWLFFNLKLMETLKKYQIPKIVPNYIELIFRNDSKLSTAGGLPDDGTITEEK